MKPLSVLLPLLALLSACAGAPQTRELRATQTTEQRTQAKAIEISQTPFYPAADALGASSALAALLAFNHAGQEQENTQALTPQTLATTIFADAKDDSSRRISVATAARQQGQLLYPLAPHLASVLSALEQGLPVLALTDSGWLRHDWHYVVVVGADRGQELLWLRTGNLRRQEMSFSDFEKIWQRADHWSALVIDPAQIPDSLDARAVIRELVGLEEMGQLQAAQTGYTRSLMNWPTLKTAWLGLAGVSQKLGQNQRAESVLRELVRREPNYGPGLNNLASLLLQDGRAEEALPYAERAVHYLDMPQTRATLAATQKAIADQKKP